MLPALIVGALTAWYLGLRAGVIAAIVTAAAMLVATFIPGATLVVYALVHARRCHGCRGRRGRPSEGLGRQADRQEALVGAREDPETARNLQWCRGQLAPFGVCSPRAEAGSPWDLANLPTAR